MSIKNNETMGTRPATAITVNELERLRQTRIHVRRALSRFRKEDGQIFADLFFADNELIDVINTLHHRRDGLEPYRRLPYPPPHGHKSATK